MRLSPRVVFFGLLAFLASCASLRLPPVPYVIMQQDFRSGDSITIDEVRCSSPAWAMGDTILVHGHYTLSSEFDAMLGMYITASKGSGQQSPGAMNRQPVTFGRGTFELSCVIDTTGRIHVSFYSARDARSFGDVYFAPDAAPSAPALPATSP